MFHPPAALAPASAGGVRVSPTDIQGALAPTPERSRIVAPRTRTSDQIMRFLARVHRLVVPPLACVLVGAWSCSTPMASSTPAASAAGAVTESDVRRLLGALSDDSLEGRMTATRGSARAAAIIAAEMRRIGLAPAGDSGYFQRVAVAVTTQSRTMPNGTVVTRTRPMMYPSFAALDTVPASRR